MKRFSWQRLLAIFIKEFQQMLRDRLTFAIMIMMPIMQLILFGFAINTDPRHLPAAIELREQCPMDEPVIEAVDLGAHRSAADGRCVERGDVA